MDCLSSQISPTCKFCGVPKPAGNIGKSSGHGNIQLNSILFEISVTETGKRKNAKVSWACKDPFLILVAKGSFRKKYGQRFKGSNPGFCEGGEWRCKNGKGNLTIIAGGGQSGYERSANGINSGDLNTERDDDLFERQGYEDDREVDGRSGRDFIRGEFVDQRRPMRRTSLGYERGRGNYQTTAPASDSASDLFERQGYEDDRAVDGRSGRDFIRGEFVDNRTPMRRTFLGYERGRGNYQTAAPASDSASTNGSFNEEAAGFDRHRREEDEIAQSSANPSARDSNGLTTFEEDFEEELESMPRAPASNSYDEDILDKRRAYTDNRRETSENFSANGLRERPKSVASRDEELLQRSNNQRESDSYLSNDNLDRESFASVSGQGAERGVTSIEDKEVAPAERQRMMPGAAAPADEREESPTRRYELTRTSLDRDPGRSLYKEESTGGRRNSGRQYRNAKEGSMLGRNALYAKQVISQATARSVGVVAQVSVDLDSLTVVALEVRPNLLFGKFHSIRPNSLNRIGDVILIGDESAVLEDLDLFNCDDLVGSDLFTESGFCLGKVRDYDFRLDDGAVLSLEFDTFGVPLIPSNLISTYSLTVDEVIEAQEDGLLVRNGAEKRIRKLTKGLFPRPSQSLRRQQQSPSKERRRELPQLPSPRSSSATGAAARSVGNMGSQVGVDGQGNYEISKLTPSRDQESFLRERSYPEERKASNAPLQSSAYESSTQEYRSSSADENLISEDRDDYKALAPDEREGRMTDTPKTLGNRRIPPQTVRSSNFPTRIDNRGIPMSYRRSRGVVETNDP